MKEYIFKSQINIGDKVIICSGELEIAATVVSIVFTGAGNYEVCCAWIIEGQRIKDWFYLHELRPVGDKDKQFGFTNGNQE